MTLDYFNELIAKTDNEAKVFVTELRNRIKSIELTLGDDFETKEYERKVTQIKFLERVINTIVSQQNISVQLTNEIAKDMLWSLDKETELAQVKLELSRMKQNNALLLKLFPKLVINNSTK